MNSKKKCFVIMPFSRTKSCTKEEWTGIFKGIIKPAVEESGLGYVCERSVAERQNIIKGILESVNQANVVADLTDNNPNVFYELGVRHTLANRTILIAQGEKDIPFDLKPYPTTFYSKSLTNIEEFKNDIQKKLVDIETNPERSDNPVSDFLKDKNIMLLSVEKSVNLKKLTALISELSYNINSIDSILDSVKISEERRKKDKHEFTVSTERLSNICLELLLSTSYITLSQKLLEITQGTNVLIRLVNASLELWSNKMFTEEVEGKLKRSLPRLKNVLPHLLEDLAKIRLDYANDNYLEPKESVILLASPEHEKYLKVT